MIARWKGIEWGIKSCHSSKSEKSMGKPLEGANLRIFKIVIFDIYTLIPTKSTMLITNMKEIL